MSWESEYSGVFRRPSLPNPEFSPAMRTQAPWNLDGSAFTSAMASPTATLFASTSSGLGRLTEPGTVMGTAAYLPPEGLAGQPPTPAWDVWAMGVLLYRMLGARLPFRAQSFEELRALILQPDPEPITTLAPSS